MVNVDSVGLKKRNPEALASFRQFLKTHCGGDMEQVVEAISSATFAIADDDTMHASSYMFDESFTFTDTGWNISK
jgi:hypothetical protein